MMKKLLITGSILTLIGVVAALAGFSMGASTNLVWHNGVKIAHSYNQTHKIKKIDKLQLDLNDYDVTFKTGDHYSVQTQGLDLSKPTITRNGQTLTIESQSFDVPGLWLDQNFSKQITITVPTDTKLSSISGTLGNGDFETMSALSVNNLDLQMDNGDFETNNLTVNNTGQLTIQNGEVELDSAHLNNTTVSQQNGALSVENSTLIGGNYSSHNGTQELDNTAFQQSVDVHNQNGKVEMESPDTQGYQLSSENGRIRLFNQRAAKQLNQNESATNKIVVSTQNGRIEIE